MHFSILLMIMIIFDQIFSSIWIKDCHYKHWKIGACFNVQTDHPPSWYVLQKIHSQNELSYLNVRLYQRSRHIDKLTHSNLIIIIIFFLNFQWAVVLDRESNRGCSKNIINKIYLIQGVQKILPDRGGKVGNFSGVKVFYKSAAIRRKGWC